MYFNHTYLCNQLNMYNLQVSILKTNKMRKITFLFVLFVTTLSAQEILVNSDFSTLTNGALVGQNSWIQYNAASANPLTVNNGVVTWAGAGLADDQDAMITFPSVINQPSEGVTTINFDVVLSISSAGASAPSYFLALNTFNTTVTASNFQNARIAAITNGDGYVLGGRINGQSGYPFAYGTTKLTFNTFYAVRAQIKIVAGNANDTLKLYVGSDFSNLTLHSTNAYTTGTVLDPTFGAVLISQYGSATVIESGVSIKSIKVTNLGTIVTDITTPKTDLLNVSLAGRMLTVKNAVEGSIVDIYSAVGARVQTAQLANGAIQLTNLSKGLYIVRIGKLSTKIMM